ncbi:hypothetical protein V6N11_000953 [Hibiscus sabdariffa]|uniref:Uncharacterized protein n=1 Tax=Hibiscus sabdariffa TaxID=183260 RepID=A0ABR2RZ38_9ROSI
MADKFVAGWILVCIVLVAARMRPVAADSNHFNACFEGCHQHCKNDGHCNVYCELTCDADCGSKEAAAKNVSRGFFVRANKAIGMTENGDMKHELEVGKDPKFQTESQLKKMEKAKQNLPYNRQCILYNMILFILTNHTLGYLLFYTSHSQLPPNLPRAKKNKINSKHLE